MTVQYKWDFMKVIIWLAIMDHCSKNVTENHTNVLCDKQPKAISEYIKAADTY
jgi:hypothetical protein